jgi:hypothetical protein
MKNMSAALVFIVSLSFVAQAQPTPQLLKEPASWSFERFALPPVFAPRFPYKGEEELRFSPGMFNKDSTNYFTYAFAAQLDSTTTISQNDVRNYLLDYFRGLCSSTAKDRKLVVDTTKVAVSVERKKGTPDNEIIYNALLNILGVFADGAPVKLNSEVKVLMDSAAKKTYLIFIASPHEKTDDVWKELYMIQKDFVLPIREKK